MSEDQTCPDLLWYIGKVENLSENQAKKKLDYRSSRNDVVGQFWDTLIPFLLGSDSVELKFELRLTALTTPLPLLTLTVPAAPLRQYQVSMSLGIYLLIRRA